MRTIFQRTEISEPVLFGPSDTTKRIENFPEICISTFSENIIEKFSSLKGVEKIAELYSANGILPVYKIRYKDKEIAFLAKSGRRVYDAFLEVSNDSVFLQMLKASDKKSFSQRFLQVDGMFRRILHDSED